MDEALSLAGRRALITGASLGIGRATARLFARLGASVAIHHASAVDAAMGYPDAAADLMREIRAGGATAVVVDADLADRDAGAQVVSGVVSAWGGIDILVLCASVQKREPLFAVTATEVDREYRINFASTVECLQAALPGMIAQRFGRIVSIGSINQVRPHAELSIYAALKAAQHNLIVGIARQHAHLGITANTISPGLIATPRNESRRRDPEQWRAIQHQANPMHRAGAPDEVAYVAALLAAPAGAFITGADIPIDGGGRL